MEGSGSLDRADSGRFRAEVRLTPTPAPKPPESLWCGLLCDWTLQDFSGLPPKTTNPRRTRGLDEAGGMALRLRGYSSVSEMYTAVLAVSNTPPRSPSTWVKSVGEGPFRLDRAGHRLPKPSGSINRGYTGIDMTSLPSDLRGVGGSFPGFRAYGV